jgi:hypothetical protein
MAPLLGRVVKQLRALRTSALLQRNQMPPFFRNFRIPSWELRFDESWHRRIRCLKSGARSARIHRLRKSRVVFGL